MGATAEGKEDTPPTFCPAKPVDMMDDREQENQPYRPHLHFIVSPDVLQTHTATAENRAAKVLRAVPDHQYDGFSLPACW